MTHNHPAVVALSAVFGVFACLFFYNITIRNNVTGFLLKRFRPGETVVFFSEKLAGFLIFGVLPFLLMMLFTDLTGSESGLTLGRMAEHRTLIAFSVLTTLVLTYVASGIKPGGDNISKQNMSEQTPGNLFSVSAGWILYLAGYEFMFRGVLWFLCFRSFGFLPSIIINLLIYSLAHYNQGRLQVIGSIPAGIVFCTLAYLTGSFIPALILHITMAVGYEFFTAFNVPVIKLRPGFKNERQ